MRKSRFSEEQIIAILKLRRNRKQPGQLFSRRKQAGISAADLCRKHGLSDATSYKWRSKYSGMEVSDAKRLKQLEGENARLKKLLAEQMMDVSTLREMLGKNFWRPIPVEKR